MLELIRDLSHNHGMSVFFSTHILPDIENLCDKVVVLHRGKFLAYGGIEDLRKGDESFLDVRVLGDAAAFRAALEKRGFRISLQEGMDFQLAAEAADGAARRILEAAVETGAQVRRLQSGRASLEDLFTRLVEG